MTNILKDPEMKEIVISFCDESDLLCKNLESTLVEFEDNLENTKLLETFGQIIDRIMGAAKSLEAKVIGQYCELGKMISYKASQTSDQKLLVIVAATLADTVEIVQSLLRSVRARQEEKSPEINIEAYNKRMTWLLEKLKNISRASVSTQENSIQDNLNQGKK